MARRIGAAERRWHRKTAVDLFNHVWTLLEKPRRTKDEDLAMVHEAHASRYHWSVVGTAVNAAIGEWQVSHVYAVLGRPEPARYHAERCLGICRSAGIRGFPLAFAHEALARAAAVAGERRDLRRHLAAAERAGRWIDDDEDREEFFRQLGTITRRGRT